MISESNFPIQETCLDCKKRCNQTKLKHGVHLVSCKFVSVKLEADEDNVNHLIPASDFICGSLISIKKLKRNNNCPSTIMAQKFGQWSYYIVFGLCITEMDKNFTDTVWKMCLSKLAYLYDNHTWPHASLHKTRKINR